jgi:8-oxo-dGTP pyrophosphatase MutT (NUDIX family)
MRDYKKEYREYHSSKTQKLRRAMRNKANRKLNPGPGKEVDHKTPLSAGGSNSESNWRVVSKSTNRKKYNKTANLKEYLYDNAGMLIGAPVGTVLGYNYGDDPSLVNAVAGTSLGAGFGLGIDMLRREGLDFFYKRPAELLSSKALSTAGGVAGGLPGAAVGAVVGTNLGSRVDKQLHSKTASDERKIRPRVALWLHDGNGNLLVEDNRQKGLGFKFPAGGIDPGQSINEAARREALEEVGYSLAESPRAIPGIRAVNVKWDPVFLAEAAKKGRNFWGSRHYHRIARAGAQDRSLLGSEGDALNASWVPADDLLRETRNAANDPNNKYNYFDRERLRVAEVVAKLLRERQKTASSKDFSPDFTPKQLKEMGVYDEVYGDKPSKASMKEWPEHWINKQDPLGWLQWYERYSDGRRTEDDARQIKRWKSFKSRHLAQYKKKPTERREAALRNWGIDVKKASYDGPLGVFLKLSEKGVAKKTDPSKWEAAKREAKARMGGKHSARAMQLATQIYKKKGGGYSGKKPSAKSNKLKKWTKQDWQWSGERKKNAELGNLSEKIAKSKGVYLPAKAIDAYKSSDKGKAKLRAAVRKKTEATKKGKQFSSHGLHKGKKRSEV